MHPSFAVGIRNGLLTAEHRQKMGIAVWDFLWLVDKVTEEYTDTHGETRGKVFGGAPVESERMAADLGVHPDTVRDNLRRLELSGYIIRTRCRNGYRIEVRHSKKWPDRSFSSDRSTASQSDSARLGESENRTTGGSSDSPSLRVSDSPIASIDIAMGKDITTEEDEERPPASETDQPEPEQLWERVVGQVEPQFSQQVGEILRQCRPVRVSGSHLQITRPPADDDWTRIRRLEPVLQQAVREVCRSGTTISWCPPDFEARAGP